MENHSENAKSDKTPEILMHPRVGDECPRNNASALEKGMDSENALPPLEAIPRIPDLGSAKPGRGRSARLHLISLCFCLFIIGWNDGSTGPLLNRIKSVYHVGFVVVSLIFVTTCMGFLVGAIVNIYLTDKLGFGKVLIIGSLTQLLGYLLQFWAPPFPLFCIACWISGVGIALQDSQANGYVAQLQGDTSVKFGLLHSIYGLGALVAPLVSTQFADLPRWSFHYLVSAGLSLLNAITLTLVFRGRSLEECYSAVGQRKGGRLDPPELSADPGNMKYGQVMLNKTVQTFAIFSFLYLGIGVTIGGWTVTYITLRRGGGNAAGYISTGFYGGITVGRIFLLWINSKIKLREGPLVLAYGIIGIGLELIVWLVPSLVGNAIAVSFVGLFLGPIYPIMLNRAGRLIPASIITGAVGWIAGVGTVGAALFPFITGTLASKFGVQSLQPMLVVLMAILMIVWLLSLRLRG